MKKSIIIPIVSLLVVISPACRAQPLDVHNPAGHGLYRGIPYLTTWSQGWLTNRNGASAARMMFGDTNAATFIWQQLQPFAYFQNTNALTPQEVEQLNFASTLRNAVNFGPLVDSSGMGSTWTNPDGDEESESTYNVLVTPPGPPGMFTGISAPVFVILDPDRGWSTSFSSVSASDPELGVPDSFVPSIPYVTPHNYISPNAFQQTFFGCLALTTPFGYSVPSYSTNYEGAHFVPEYDEHGNITNYFVAYTGTNITQINTLTRLAATNLWFVDKYGNQWTRGTNQATAFVGDGSRLTGITSAQVGAVPTTDSAYQSISTLANTVAAHSSAISGLQGNTSFPLNSAPFQTYSVTVATPLTPGVGIAPNYMQGLTSISGTPFVNTYGRRALFYVNYNRTNSFSIILSNATTSMMLSYSNSIPAGQVSIGSGVMDMPASPGDTVQIYVNAVTNCILLRAWAVGL